MGATVLGILVWQEGGESVAALMVVGGASLAGLGLWLVRAKAAGRVTLIDPGLFRSPAFRLGISGQLLQQIALGGAMIVLPIYFQIVLEYDAFAAGLSLAPLSLSMFAMSMLMSRRGGAHRPCTIIGWGFALLVVGTLVLIPWVPRAESGWAFVPPLVVAGSGLGLLVSQLNNYTLSPISDERVSEAAGVNSAGGSFGLSFGLAFAGAIMLATLSFAFTEMAGNSDVLPEATQAQVADALETDAELVTNTNLEALLADQPAEISDEIVRINSDARPIALQVALLVPLLAAALGLVVAVRMRRLPDPVPSGAADSVLGG
jgi:Na+/melibiose symporter-like transporter